MYYPDLSPCTYSHVEPGHIAVGWLDRVHPFPQGMVPSGLVERLIALSWQPAIQHRGLHACEFCPPDQSYEVFLSMPSGEQRYLASAIIYVPAGGSRVFAAPTLISHYIAAHGYQPPAEFIDAVLNPPVA